MSNLTRRWCWT